MKILSSETVQSASVDWDSLDPSFRRATKNMTLATMACKKILQSLPLDTPRESISVVVGTHFGEMSSTIDFLGGEVASPTLFQNSLHNSILGFVTVSLGLTGPALTVSCDHLTEQASKDLAETLLQITPFSLVCIVDSVPEDLRKLCLENYPFAEKFVDQATCLLLGRG
jgi:3-oxoacyl-(acyl-carrier-protein) synthase